MKAVVYGIGKKFYNLFILEENIDIGLIKNQIEIIGFSDGNSDKWGETIIYDGQFFDIQNIKNFSENNFDKILVTSKQNYKEIYQKLKQEGYREDQILLIDKIFEQNPELINYNSYSFFNRQWVKVCSIGGVRTLFQGKSKKIGIYGLGEITNHLISDLDKSADLSIEYLISPDSSGRVNSDLPIYCPDLELPLVELIIVAELKNYMKIETVLCQNNAIEVISIQELVYKALKNARGV